MALVSPKYNLVEVGYPFAEYPFPNIISYLSNLGKTKSSGMHLSFGIFTDNTTKLDNEFSSVTLVRILACKPDKIKDKGHDKMRN